MKLNLDQIIFENRREIEQVLSALEQFLKEHPDAKEAPVARELADKLDVMHMSW